MTETIQIAADIARELHKDQKRKYDGSPYFTHLERVAALASAYGMSENQVAAAFQHDLIEDTNITAEGLYDLNVERGIDRLDAAIITSLVVQLTDVYTKEKYPDLNRAARKKLEAARLGRISKEAADIKLLDLIDNSRDILTQDSGGFAKKYLEEKKEILSYFEGNTNPVLFALAESNIGVS